MRDRAKRLAYGVLYGELTKGLPCIRQDMQAGQDSINPAQALDPVRVAGHEVAHTRFKCPKWLKLEQ